MIKTITKVGNSSALILDSALLALAHLKQGDQVNVEVHSGGTVTITPVRPVLRVEDVAGLIGETMKEYAQTMSRLA
jgi:antitoxin component of MazEF toxin-antitoxin module